MRLAAICFSHMPSHPLLSGPANSPWRHRFAVLTALATLLLIGMGGLVTSNEAGMSVPDWPTSNGYNMFALPIKFWKGGIFYEHTHRLWASLVGVLVVALTRWLGGRASRRPLAIIGLAEVLAGCGIFLLWPNLRATGHFLTGIGGVVLLAALVWARNAPPKPPLVQLGWLAFALVQFQGLLGGLRVVLFDSEIGIFHAALAQLFFVLLCVIALLTSKWWQNGNIKHRTPNIEHRIVSQATEPRSFDVRCSMFSVRYFPNALFLFATGLIFLQLVLGATMRHQHAGLAIPDFPLAYGRIWPATDAASVASYNEHRMELTAANPITAFQIDLQMAHRVVAVLILAAVIGCSWSAFRNFTWRSPLTKLAALWLGLILVQVALGAATIWSKKAADIATAHVLVGAVSLAAGALSCIICFRNPEPARAVVVSPAGAGGPASRSFAAKTAPAQ